MRIVEGADEGRRTLLRRRPAEEALPAGIWQRTQEATSGAATVEEAVRRILADVREQGDEAVLRYCRAFDGAEYSTLQVASADIQAAYDQVEPEIVEALRFAAGRVRAFHEEQRRHAMQSFRRNDGIGVQVRAVRRAGAYVPGTVAVYPSSLLMTALPAKAAGVEQVIVASPADARGCVSPLKLVAADIAGVDAVFRMSGAQAIAALAYGTASVPQVDKVCGPGNVFVTEAKRQVFGSVGIDALYGPSETIVVADESANPVFCAADLLAQAEHDELATPILITTSRELAERAGEEVERQLTLLERERIARTSFEARGGAIVVASIEEAIALADEFAPEHLCLLVRDAPRWAERVRNAGGIFVGERSPETLGDYTAGPSHVMPTSGTARFASPLGVQDFLKVTSIVAVDDTALRELGALTARIARAEGLTAHARSIELRLEQR